MGKKERESGKVESQQRERFAGKTVVDLGSGTGIGPLAALKFTLAKKVVMTDYTEEILSLLHQNVKMQPVSKVQSEMALVDWTKEETYNRIIGDERIDIVLATDVIYKGSPYDELCRLLKAISISNPEAEIMIIIPKQRDCREDFLQKMSAHGFAYDQQELEGPEYRYKALQNEKDSDKFYPGLKQLTFDMFTFKLTSQH